VVCAETRGDDRPSDHDTLQGLDDGRDGQVRRLWPKCRCAPLCPDTPAPLTRKDEGPPRRWPSRVIIPDPLKPHALYFASVYSSTQALSGADLNSNRAETCGNAFVNAAYSVAASARHIDPIVS